MEKEMKVIIDNWMEFHPVITNAELGWNEECIRDAMSEDPKEIFNYFWHNFFSIIFYYVDDGKNHFECKIREVLKKQREKIKKDTKKQLWFNFDIKMFNFYISSK